MALEHMRIPMPETKNINDSDFAFVYTGIGRGHPHYLDGIIDSLEQHHPQVKYFKVNVFQVSRGMCHLAWRLIRWLYLFGSKGGLITPLYSLARNFSGSSEGNTLLYRWLGRDLKKFLNEFDRVIVVAHPILAKILARHGRVVYQHGELACPREAIVRGCEKILVPWEATAEVMRRAAIPPEQITITGQGIELGLIGRTDSAFRERIKRLKGDQPLTAALFSSGAYPAAHLQKLLASGKSLLDAGHKVNFFAGESARVAANFKAYFARNGYQVEEKGAGGRLRIISSQNRSEGNHQVAAFFDSFDIFIAPAHERTNWSLALGLPQFMLCPHIGSYAPLNAAIAREKGVARDIPNTKVAMHFAETLEKLRSEGELVEMAQRGFGRTDLYGFRNATEIILVLGQQDR